MTSMSEGRWLNPTLADPARTGQEMMRPVGSPGYAAPEVIAVMPQRYNEKVPRSVRACEVNGRDLGI